jgi:hypothetical protein
MLPLAAETLPSTTTDLTAALQRGFEGHGLSPRKIVAQGGDFPHIAELRIDLTGSKIGKENLPGAVAGDGLGLTIDQFALFGEPVYFLNTPLNVRIDAEKAKMVIAGTPQAGSLKLETAEAGTVAVSTTVEALEELLLSVVSEAAEKQGVAVKGTKLTLHQEGPRAITFRAEVTAKVFIMSATLAVTGRLDVDAAFNARLSSLALDGDPMVTGLAGSFLRPRLQQLEGRTFPLLAFSPGGMKLRDIEMSVKPDLRLQARFGGEA